MYFFDSCTTFGAKTMVANMVGMAIRANALSIKLIMVSKLAVAPSRMLAMNAYLYKWLFWVPAKKESDFVP